MKSLKWIDDIEFWLSCFDGIIDCSPFNNDAWCEAVVNSINEDDIMIYIINFNI